MLRVTVKGGRRMTQVSDGINTQLSGEEILQNEYRATQEAVEPQE